MNHSLLDFFHPHIGIGAETKPNKSLKNMKKFAAKTHNLKSEPLFFLKIKYSDDRSIVKKRFSGCHVQTFLERKNYK